MPSENNPAHKPLFLMSPPRKDWGLRGRENFKSRAARGVAPGEARAEWRALADAIVEAGGHVLVLPPAPHINLTGMIYTAEAGEFFQDDAGAPCWLLPNMAPPHRREEATWIGGFMSGLGIETAAVSARWEAQGDVLHLLDGRVVHTFGVGEDARTTREGCEEARAILGREDIVLEFNASPWFHGNTFMNAYHGDHESILLVCDAALGTGERARLSDFVSASMRIESISVAESEAYVTNALQVSRTVIAPSDTPERIRALWRALGLNITALDLPQLFHGGGGAPVCMTNRLHGFDPDSVPARHLWRVGDLIEAYTRS